MRIAILGAQGSGKSWLAQQLAADENRITLVESCLPVDVRKFDLILLMGLDFCPQGAQQKQDAALRTALDVAPAAYQVIYGHGQLRLASARSVIRQKFATLNIADNAIFHTRSAHESRIDDGSARWQWRCEKCSDAECEHRLFTALKRDKAEATAKPPACPASR